MMRKKILAVFLAAIFIALAAWEIYVNFYAPRAVIIFITTYHLDKIAHLLGGAFIAGLVLLAREQSRARTVVLFTVILALAWEALELLFDPKVIYFFEKEKQLWLEDFSGDLVAGMLGAALFLILWRRIFS